MSFHLRSGRCSKHKEPSANDLARWKRRKATLKFFARQRDREQKVRY